MVLQPPPPVRRAPSSGDAIEVHVGELNQLFNSLDPSPFHEKELDRDAEEYIVGSALELPAKFPAALVVYVDKPPGPPNEMARLADAVHAHFARLARFRRLELRQLMRRGWVSLGIGLAFLAACVGGGQTAVRLMGETAVAHIVQESLLVGGWVAMWRPLEIFLYDWWPIVAQRRLYDRLSQIPVRIDYPAEGSSGPTSE